jgi:hypothetical protein
MAPAQRCGCFNAIWLVAASLPLLSLAAAVFVNFDDGWWPSMPWSSLVPDALLYSASAIVILAPLSGLLAASTELRDSPPGEAVLRRARCVLFAVGLFAIGSSILTRFAAGPGSWTLIATSHATIAAVAMALAAFGAFCATTFSDPLDAAACSLASVLIVAAGVLVAGTWVGLAPAWLVRTAVFVSPLVAMTAASGIDLVRIDLLYQISPLAHLRIDYPTWYVACGWYTFLTLGFLSLCWIRGAARTAAAC